MAICKLSSIAFHERTKQAFAVIATGETLFYRNVVVRKGTIHFGDN